MSGDANVTRTRLFMGHTIFGQISDGVEIEFMAGEPPIPFQEGWQLGVGLPDNARQVLSAEPAHGPTHVGWHHQSEGYWIFPLTKLKPGLWRVDFEEQHRWLKDKADAHVRD